MVKQGTTSWTMARVLAAIQALPVYKKMKGKMVVAHTAGEGNLASDDASRGKFDELARYCTQVGAKPRQMVLTPEVWDFLGGVKADLGL